MRAISVLFFSAQSFAQAPVSTEAMRNLFLEKKVPEAISILKEAHQKKPLPATQQKQISQWLATFQYDGTLGLFEKAREEILDTADGGAVVEKSLKQALEKEPYNTVVLSHYLGFLLSQNKDAEAKEKILWAKSEMPYMEIYNVFWAWLVLKEGRDLLQNSYSCRAGTLSTVEQDFCMYVKLLEKTQETKSAVPTEEILSLKQKIKIPNKHMVLWKKWHDHAEKQKYISSCQSMSGKQKKAYLFVPEFCVHKEKETLE